MAHWAQLDENNKVIQITVGDNNSPDEGYQWLIDNLGGIWIKTSYNANFGGKFAGIGDTWDGTNFISPTIEEIIEAEIIEEQLAIEEIK